MALLRKKPSIPTKEDALPGRSAPLKVPEKHFVNGTASSRHSPPACAKPFSASAASGAPSDSSGSSPACTPPRSAMPAA